MYACSKTLGKRKGNGSVAAQEQSHNLTEVATEAPSKKPGGLLHDAGST